MLKCLLASITRIASSHLILDGFPGGMRRNMSWHNEKHPQKPDINTLYSQKNSSSYFVHYHGQGLHTMRLWLQWASSTVFLLLPQQKVWDQIFFKHILAWLALAWSKWISSWLLKAYFWPVRLFKAERVSLSECLYNSMNFKTGIVVFRSVHST